MPIRNNVFAGPGKGVSLPAGSAMDVDSNVFLTGSVGVEERDAPTPLVQAPPEELLRILREYMVARPTTEEAATERLQKSGTERWLKAGHTLFEVAKWSITHPHEIAELISQLEKMAPGAS